MLLEVRSVGEPMPDALLAHVEWCADCRAEWTRLTRTHESLTQYGRQIASAPSDPIVGRAAILHRIRSEETAAKQHPLAAGLRRSRTLTLIAGVSAAIMGGIYLLPGGPMFDRVKGRANTSLFTQKSGEKNPVDPLENMGTKKDTPSPLLPSSPTTRTVAQKTGEASSLLIEEGSSTRKPVTRLVPPTAPQVQPLKGTGAGRPHRSHSPTKPFVKSPPPAHSVGQKSGSPVPLPKGDDLDYINDLPSQSPPEIERRVNDLLASGDDFVTVPLPRIAAHPSAQTKAIVAQAMKQYEAEKQVIDSRLFQKVTLQMKGGDLKTLADQLSEMTGVRFYVAKDLADVKLSVFVKETPVRDLMRQIVRLFNLQWSRRGEEEGKYRYELSQALRQKLEEEELRRRDEDELFLMAMEKVQSYLPFSDLPQGQLHEMAKWAEQKARISTDPTERESHRELYHILWNLANRETYWDALLLYPLMSQDQLMALRNGQEVVFSYKGEGSERSMPQQMAERRIADYRSSLAFFGQKISRLQSLGDLAPENFTAEARFVLERNTPDQVSFVTIWREKVKVPGGGVEKSAPTPVLLATGRVRSVETARNKDTHRHLEKLPEYQVRVSLEPQSERRLSDDAMQQVKTGRQEEWVDSADFYRMLHLKTGYNVVADYYTRIYPGSIFRAEKQQLFDLLNNAADELKSDWWRDGEFLRFRHFTYYTERTLDIPNRLLSKWIITKRRLGYLPVGERAEIATMPDRIFEHAALQRALAIKYELDEAAMLPTQRNLFRFFIALNRQEREQAQTFGGLRLTPEQAARALEATGIEMTVPAEQLSQAQFHIRVRPPGVYEWHQWTDDPKGPSIFPVTISVREASRKNADRALESILRTRGAPSPQIESEKKRISGGPKAGGEIRLQIGHFKSVMGF